MFNQGSHHPCVAFAGGHHQGGGGGHQAGPFLDKGVQQVRKVLGTSLLGSAPEARSSLVVSALPLLAASHRSQLSWEESRGTGLELMRGLAENSCGKKVRVGSEQTLDGPGSSVEDLHVVELFPYSQHPQTLP